MTELRWALIGLGLVFFLGLALWEWRRSSRAPRQGSRPEPPAPDITLITERPRRVEPGLGEVPGVMAGEADDAFDVPTILPREVPVSPEQAVDVPAAARDRDGDAMNPAKQVERPARAEPARPPPTPVQPVAAAPPAPVSIRWPPARADRVLTLRVVKMNGDLLPGRALRVALEAAGLVSGPQQIFHRADAEGAVIVSAANLVQPGILDPAQMDAAEYRGLTLFSVLPGPLPPVRMLEELVAAARSVAHRLGAIVEDEQGADLDGRRLAELRRSLPQGGGAGGGWP
jgi:cell division protein ZipA